MDFKFKKPSKKTQIAMSKIALGDNTDYSNEAIEKVLKLTKHKYGKLLNSGNSAILLALSYFEGNVILPDQGGWNGFKQIARYLNKDFILTKTNKSLIDIKQLKEDIKKLDKTKKNCLLLTSFGAYTAEQDIKAIAELCHTNDIYLIEDVSGSIGDNKLANGNYSDIIISSTGSPKIVNVGNGGFISTNINEIFNEKSLLNIMKCDKITSCGIFNEIDNAKTILTKTIKACSYLKENLDDVIHTDKRGVNVIVSSEDPKNLVWNLKKEINIENRSIITKCPNYNRIKEKAVAIEIKNLDVSCLNKSNMDLIIELIKKYQ